ncbi:hypothetical protein GGI24_000176 [Coemansia furcata]|nr:hypothetical protein GGI24_000176 [Coemansia furcata]
MTGARPLISDLLDSSSDSDFETTTPPAQTSIPLAKDPLPEARQAMVLAENRTTPAKVPGTTTIDIAATSTLVKGRKPSGSRARKPKSIAAELIPPEQPIYLEKPPTKRAKATRVTKPKPARKTAKPISNTPVLSLTTTQGKSHDGTRPVSGGSPKASSSVCPFSVEAHTQLGHDAVYPSSQLSVSKLEYPTSAAIEDRDIANGLSPAPSALAQQFAEQAIDTPDFLVEAMPKRTTRARTSSASNHSSTKSQGRPRKVSRVHANTNVEPFAGAITAAKGTLDDLTPSATEPLSEHNYVVTVSSGNIENDTTHAANATDYSAGLDANTTTQAESQRIEQSPISGGNVTRRRAAARGKRPAAVDRAPVNVDRPVLIETTNISDDLLPRTTPAVIQGSSLDNRHPYIQSSVPNGGLGSAQISAQPTQCTIASTADAIASNGRRRSSRIMLQLPNEERCESNSHNADSAMADTNGVDGDQYAGDLEHETEDGISQQRQLLGTRPMRFKAPHNARARTFEMDDIDPETLLEGAAEANTQNDLLATPTRRSTSIRDRQSNAESSPIPIPLSLPEAASQSILHDRHDSPLESASIHPQLTPTRSQQDNRRATDHLRTPVPAATPRRDKLTSASHLPDVPHSPSRVATPHRVIYSPQHPMTHFKPAIARANHEDSMPSATPRTAQPGSTPGAKSSRVRISEQFRPSLPPAPLLRLSSGSATGRMSTSGGDASSELEIEETRVPFLPARRYVQKGHILAACGQTAPIDWVSGGLQACGVLLPEFDSTQLSDPQMGEMEGESGLCKIGEATYSEVFSAQWRYVPRTRYDNFNSKKGKVKGERLMQVALKVIPFGNSAVKSGTGEPQTTLRDLYQEIGATLALSRLSERERAKLQEARMQVKKPLKPKERELGANFVKAFRVCICQGPLPAPLLRAWDRWKAEYPDLCENMRPDYYPPNQLFAVFVLEMGGETLENAAVSTWKEARSIIRQLALSMALAERHNQFEHRDLHWGNIMVTRSNSNLTFLYQLPPTGARVKSALMSIPSYKVRCTIIDYTLSRLHIDNDTGDVAANKPANYNPARNVFYVALKDEALFQGQGDIQYDVYRQMRLRSKDDWEGFHPHTNVMWLTYAFQKILVTKAPAIKHELLEFAESKLGPAFDAVLPELKRAAGQELLKRWIREFEQCESTSDVLKCALLDLYKS